MNLVMVGFMGAGKTTIGRRLARRLGYFFLDMDNFIVREENKEISEIFSEHGELFFRQMETNLLRRLISVENTIVSTGGGVVGTEGNFELLRKIGTTVYLKAPREDIIERLKRSQHRPLVQENLEETVFSLMKKRAPLYEQADHIIETQGLTPHQIASQIIQAL